MIFKLVKQEFLKLVTIQKGSIKFDRINAYQNPNTFDSKTQPILKIISVNLAMNDYENKRIVEHMLQMEERFYYMTRIQIVSVQILLKHLNFDPSKEALIEFKKLFSQTDSEIARIARKRQKLMEDLDLDRLHY